MEGFNELKHWRKIYYGICREWAFMSVKNEEKYNKKMSFQRPTIFNS